MNADKYYMENENDIADKMDGFDFDSKESAYTYTELLYFAELYAAHKVKRYASQLTMSQFIHEGPTKSVETFLNNDK